MRINSLPYLHEAGQALMTRLAFKLSSKLSIFISFTSANPKRLKLPLRRTPFFFPFLGPVISFLRTDLARPGHQHTGEVAALCHHTAQAMWTQHLSPTPCALQPIPSLRTHFNLHPSPTWTPVAAAALLPCPCLQLQTPTPCSQLQPAAAPAEIFPFLYSFLFFWWIQTDWFLGSLAITQEPVVGLAQRRRYKGITYVQTYINSDQTWTPETRLKVVLSLLSYLKSLQENKVYLQFDFCHHFLENGNK